MKKQRIKLSIEQVDKIIDLYLSARHSTLALTQVLFKQCTTKKAFRDVWKYQESIQSLRYKLEDFVFDNSDYGPEFMERCMEKLHHEQSAIDALSNGVT